MNLKKKTISGIGWNLVGNILKQLLNFIVSAILSRILSPKEFGIFGMITIFTGFASLFSSIGLGQAIIQKKDVDDSHLQTVFSVNLIMGFSLALILSMLSPLIGNFFGEPILRPLTVLVSLNYLIYSVRSVQIAMIMRKLEFKKYSVIDLSANLVSGIIAIILAKFGFGVWSLAVRTIVISLLFIIFLWNYSSWRPKLKLDFSKFKELWKFSTNLVGSNILNYWSRNIDNLLVGKYLGAFALGIYARAYYLMLLPVTQISDVINSVLFPAFSKINEDKIKVKDTYLRVIGVISFVTFPIMIGLIILAKPFIFIIYGPKWASVVPILQLLSLSGMLWSITYPFRSIFMSQGRTDLMFKWNLIESFVILLSIILGLKRGILGVAIALSLANFIILWYPSWRIPGKLINISFSAIILRIRAHFLLSLFMGLSLFLSLKYIYKFTENNLLILMIGIVESTVIYLGISLLLRLAVVQEIKYIYLMLIEREVEK